MARVKAKHNYSNLVKPDKTTLEAWLNCWLYNYMKPSLKPSTFAQYETLARVHIIPSLGKKQLQKLQTGDLQRFYNAKLQNGRVDGEGGLSSTTVRHI